MVAYDGLRFIRVEGKDGSLSGFKPEGAVETGEEEDLASALEVVAKQLRLQVENRRRVDPLTPRQVEGMAQATVLLQEMIAKFIYLDVEEAKEIIKKLREYMDDIEVGR